MHMRAMASVVLALSAVTLAAETASAPAAPKTAQESAQLFFDAVNAADDNYTPPAFLPSYKMDAAALSVQVRSIRNQTKDRNLKVASIYGNDKMARAFSTPTVYPQDNSKEVVYLNLVHEGGAWYIKDTNLLATGDAKALPDNIKYYLQDNPGTKQIPLQAEPKKPASK